MAYIVETGISKSLGHFMKALGSCCLVLHDAYATAETLTGVCEGIGMPCSALLTTAAACSKAEARLLASAIAESGADVVVAYGASKVLDLARAALKLLQPNRPSLVLVPTIVSSNACVGGLAVMYGDDGRVNGFWALDRAPELVAIDLDLVLGADPRFLSAAMGDQIASSFEAIHAAAGLPNSAGVDAHATVLDTIRSYGASALAAVRAREMTHELECVVRCVTFATAEQQASSAVFMAHMLGEVLSSEPELSNRMHGEVVAACVPAELVVTGDVEAASAWIGVLRSLGLPASLAELGLADISRSRLEAFCRAGAGGLMTGEAARRWSAGEIAEFFLIAESLAQQE